MDLEQVNFWIMEDENLRAGSPDIQKHHWLRAKQRMEPWMETAYKLSNLVNQIRSFLVHKIVKLSKFSLVNNSFLIDFIDLKRYFT